MYKRILVVLILFFFNSLTFAQSYEKEFESNFAWEVKQIDEFIERFNNNDKTLIKKYASNSTNAKDFTRERMIKSLFDSQGKAWKIEEINQFIKSAVSKPILLDFYNKDWYAKVICSVTWKGMPEVATLILKLQVFPDSSSKWVVTNVNANFLKSTTWKGAAILPAADKYVSLNPVSHATDFMNISKLTENVKNIKNYVVPVEEQTNQTKLFLQECVDKNLIIKQVSSISYHFLQIDNWILEVNQFKRQTKNSGWLISKLIKATNQEKATYKANYLIK